MKKIDLHIHTVASYCDRPFDFNLDAFKRYVTEARLDAVAVTNHDLFDGIQFREIQQALDVTVFPGIEINLEEGHILVITDPLQLEEFEKKAAVVSQRINKVGDRLSVDEFASIFGDLDRYLLIPHYDKHPSLSEQTLAKLRPHISAGEVDSIKKFVRATKDATRLTPVLFSDTRIRADPTVLPARQTFIDCGELTLSAIKACLRDKTKVSLSEKDGNKLVSVLPNGQKLSTGLNVLLGARSTGKTHTLNEIAKAVERVKYIKQFDLVQRDDAQQEREFKSDVEKQRSLFAEEYLSGLKSVVDEIIKVDLSANDRAVQRYVETLLKSAEESDRRDAYSNTALFDEVDLPVSKTNTLVELIGSVRQVLENEEFRDIIARHVDYGALRRLACDLIKLLWERTLDNEKKKFVNGLVREIKRNLKVRTAAVQVEDVDLYRVMMDGKRVQRFTEIVRSLQKEAVIHEEGIQGFRIVAQKGPFLGAGEIKAAAGVKAPFSAAFAKYEDPYEYLQELKSNELLKPSELYKLFMKISYSILNRDGFEVSGGERSEFRLLQEIADAQNYDFLLIDEPESSFDNVFLRSDVNQILKAVAETMPVVVVTHNNTVGASVGADYLLYTTKEMENGAPIYRIYSGHPSDKSLVSMDGKVVKTHDVLMNSLEAGRDAYDERRTLYEATKS